ncbi:MAG: hypothetical protein R6X33_10100 [Candidatus Brocadiia bacterium]
MLNRRAVRTLALLVAAGGLLLASAGCGHMKNIRDDAMDVGTLAVGVVPPVVPGEPTRAVGPIPPAAGIYLEATEFFHLGALYKATGDAEWDRRGAGLTVDIRRKLGIGPFHDVFIEQHPVLVNAYKMPNNEMDGWRAHMRDLSDPLFGAPAKTLIYEAQETTIPNEFGEEGYSWMSLPWMSRGWQDWEMFSVEVAIPEPFILHSGIYFRAGVDPSQVFDLVLSIVGLDLYDDAAYDWEGNLKY